MGCCPSRPEEHQQLRKDEISYSVKDTIHKKHDFYSNYIYIKELGQGMSGIVVEARNKISTMHRAVKMIPIKSLTENERKKALQEIEILRSLDHPNIMSIYEYFEDDENLIIVGELCRGGELLDRIMNRSLYSEANIAQIMRQILSAVFYLHQNNIVHRDLKPQNILFDDMREDAIVKIVDFGVSAQNESGKMLKKPTGTPIFMAPEVFKGKYNEKCDLWSCGVILYVLLSGRLPFTGKTRQETTIQILNGHYTTTGNQWKKVSLEAIDFLKKLLCYDPKERYSAEQALNDPWILRHNGGNIAAEPLATEALENLKLFRAEKKLQEIFWVFLSFHFSKSEEKHKYLKVFQDLDTNGDGKLTAREIARGYETVSKFSSVPINIEEVIRSVDLNFNGQIDYSEFVSATMERKAILHEERLQLAFDQFDKDRNGQLTLEEIKELFDPDENRNLEEAEWRNLIRDFDLNKDGQISYAEFKELMLKFANSQIEPRAKIA